MRLMRSIRLMPVVVIGALALASCSRDPNVAKRRYLESGNKYFDRARYKEAVIQYRNALKADPRYGQAHYRLALTYLKSVPPNYGGALKELRRSVELLKGQPEYWDSMVKMADIYLSPVAPRDKQILDEADKYCKELLEHDAKSFDGLRLTGDLDYVRAIEAAKVKNVDDAKKLLASALDEYQKADALKPADEGVSMMLARVLADTGDAAGSERYYRAILDRNKAFLEAYRELYRLLWVQNKRSDAEAALWAGYKNNPKQYGFLLSLAEQYLAERRLDDMQKVLQQLKSKAGEYSRAYLDVGDFYLRTGDAESAVREYREGVSKDSKNKTTYQKRVVEALLRQDKRAEAADVNAQILKDNPSDADARGVAAALLLDKGDVTKAMLELQRVVSQAPDNPVSRYNLGRAYFQHGDIEQARQQFLKAIELRPDYTLAHVELARLQVAKGDYDSALQTATDILKYDPNNGNAKLVEAAAMMGQKRFGDSRKTLDDLLKVSPNSTDVMYQIGIVNLADNKFKEAEDAFRRAYQLNPANTRGLMGVVETDMAQNKVEQAIQTLQAESAKAPTRMDFHIALGNIAVRVGRLDMGIGEFQKVLAATTKGSQEQGEIYLRLGETYRRKGDYAAAVSALQAARQSPLMTDDARVLSTLGLTLEQASRWSEARQVYEAILKVQPNNGFVLNNLAYNLAEHNGDLDQALTDANKARQLLPNLPEVGDTLAWIYLKKNLPDKALETLIPVVAKAPTNSTYHYHLGMAYAQKGDKVHAQPELKKALDSSPSKDEQAKILDLLQRVK